MSEKGNWFKRHKIWTGIIGIFVLMVIVSAVNGGSKDSSTASNNSTSSAPNSTEDKESEPAKAPENKQPEVPAEHKSALNKAKSYATTMNMSKRGVYDQLTSEYGEKFSKEAADYAIANLQADWNKNALAKAKSYQDKMNMSPAAIRDQLVSDFGEKFTAEEADYAIANLNE